ncbi:hydrogenase nickel incorporation protein HypB [Paraburkholderia sp. BL23I1N1]|uniref:hydrogenase nickel incorporation protein HypB n=1 Tax=Paraburkholderia sp. BL23I1N1 TaxID=1938802 RepID=UPI00217EAA10|nr:hydrogenase nickel incorporation protein HypB [Paraburkholderia sp. BL23I1N1]
MTDLDAEKGVQTGAQSQSQSQAAQDVAIPGARGVAYRRVSEDESGHARLHTHGHSHSHDGDHAHDHVHAHDHQHVQGSEHVTSITLEQDILAKNQLLAERNRGWLAGRSILAVNLMSSPGAGKTTLLERTIHDLGETWPLTVIEGDQATLNDAERIRATGARVVQINTGTGCHLDAEMASRALTQLDPPMHSVVMIENVGNLVCPALFDLGEGAKVLILSVTEGEDKPIKYPHMFRACSLLLLNKIDLLPYLRFDVERCIDYALRVNPRIEVLRVSAQSGEGMAAWYSWVRGKCADFSSTPTGMGFA